MTANGGDGYDRAGNWAIQMLFTFVCHQDNAQLLLGRPELPQLLRRKVPQRVTAFQGQDASSGILFQRPYLAQTILV
jgi:hypothetical protein